ncbi:protein FAM167B-like [Pecten maximus]|uniref:protein FAM167B-like n=1 Tax=Pecten maximus TaxID=6579 RepID=UPI001458AE07|nr:protein FAM167B-like [Pecten maximus]
MSCVFVESFRMTCLQLKAFFIFLSNRIYRLAICRARVAISGPTLKISVYENSLKNRANMKEYRIPTLAVIEEIPVTENCENNRLAPFVVQPETEGNNFDESNNNTDKTGETSNNDLHGNNDLDKCEKCGTENGNDLGTLKEKAAKLKLKTRRSSYVTWETEKLVRSGALFKARIQQEVIKDPQEDQKLTPERKDKINNDIGWIRRELQAMRILDQSLAKKLLNLRHEMHSLKLKWSCDDHKEMMEEVTCDLEERQVLQDVCDQPLGPVDINPLKQLGVTRMNLSARRFSTC